MTEIKGIGNLLLKGCSTVLEDQSIALGDGRLLTKPQEPIPESKTLLKESMYHSVEEHLGMVVWGRIVIGGYAKYSLKPKTKTVD